MTDEVAPKRKRSNAAKGAGYKAKTKLWLQRQGFVVADLEKMYCIKPGVFVKKDQLGADLLAVALDQTVFVQVKGGATAQTKLAAGRKAFTAFAVPPCASQVIIVWSFRARTPRIYVRRGPVAIGQGIWQETAGWPNGATWELVEERVAGLLGLQD